MLEVNAANKADEFIKLVLQHQPDAFGTYPLQDQNQAKKVAQSLAALRAELIVQLTPQS